MAFSLNKLMNKDFLMAAAALIVILVVLTTETIEKVTSHDVWFSKTVFFVVFVTCMYLATKMWLPTVYRGLM